MGQPLGPGFRFHPTDVELVLYWLKRKILGKKLLCEAIAEVNIYKYSPDDLPDKSCLKTKDLEWFFFCPREKKYASGACVKRATEKGFWKTSGKARTISHNERTVGAVNYLIFHWGHASQGIRTDWVMHEYKIIDNELAEAGVQDNYVVCKVFKKNGPGPKNGAQYGAPFNEADWTDTDDDGDGAENHSIPQAAEAPSQAAWMQNEEQSLPLGSGLLDSGNGPLPMLEEGPSSSVVAPTSIVAADETNDGIDRMLACFVEEDMLLPDGNGFNKDNYVAENHSIPQAAKAPSQTAWMQNEEQSLPLGSGLLDSGNGPLPMLEEGPSSSVVAPTSTVAADETNDEIDCMLACFVDEDMLLLDGNGFNKDDLSGNGNNRLLPCSWGLDIYNDLPDLDGWSKNEGIFDFSGSQNVTIHSTCYL